MSVNEARIEFFLLGKKNVRETIIKGQQKFREECREIQRRYAGLNYVKFPEKTEQQKKEFNEARKKYLNILNHILQSMI